LLTAILRLPLPYLCLYIRGCYEVKFVSFASSKLCVDVAWWRSGQGVGLATLPKVAGSTPGFALSGNNLGQVVHTTVTKQCIVVPVKEAPKLKTSSSRCDTIPVCDRQTDRQTHDDSMYRAALAESRRALTTNQVALRRARLVLGWVTVFG